MLPTRVKVLGAALVFLLLVDGMLAIIKKHKSKHKHKDDDDDYDDEDQSCYPGKNCVPGCYCSGEYCRPYFPPKNAAEAKLKCRTFHYPQWNLWKKGSKYDELPSHPNAKPHFVKADPDPGIISILTKANFTGSQEPQKVELSDVVKSHLHEVISHNETFNSTGTAIQEEPPKSQLLQSTTPTPMPAHPSQRAFQFLFTHQ